VEWPRERARDDLGRELGRLPARKRRCYWKCSHLCSDVMFSRELFAVILPSFDQSSASEYAKPPRVRACYLCNQLFSLNLLPASRRMRRPGLRYLKPPTEPSWP